MAFPQLHMTVQVINNDVCSWVVLTVKETSMGLIYIH